MATIAGKDLVLIDNWPGVVNHNMSTPTNGFDSTKEGSGNCVTTPAFEPGTKIEAYCDSTKNSGWYTMIYLCFIETSDYAYDLDADISNGMGIVTHIVGATEHVPDGATDWFYVTQDATNGCGTTSMGRCMGIAMHELSGGVDITNASGIGRYPEWGWFWCGGVCPCTTTGGKTDYTKTAGEIATDGSVIAGCEVGVYDDGSNTVGLAGYDFSLPLYPGPVAYSLVTDA